MLTGMLWCWTTCKRTSSAVSFADREFLETMVRIAEFPAEGGRSVTKSRDMWDQRRRYGKWMKMTNRS